MGEGGGGGTLVGPREEWLDYPSEADYQLESTAFWDIVQEVIQSFTGSYDDVPWQYRELGTERLELNG